MENRKSVTDLKSCDCPSEEDLILIGDLAFLCAESYTINISSWVPSLHLFGNLISEAVRKTERVKFILDVTPWQKTKDKFGPCVWIEVTKNVQVLQSKIKQLVKGEQRASAWEVINMCGRLEKIRNTNVNRKSEAGGRNLSLCCIIKTFSLQPSELAFHYLIAMGYIMRLTTLICKSRSDEGYFRPFLWLLYEVLIFHFNGKNLGLQFWLHPTPHSLKSRHCLLDGVCSKGKAAGGIMCCPWKEWTNTKSSLQLSCSNVSNLE